MASLREVNAQTGAGTASPGGCPTSCLRGAHRPPSTTSIRSTGRPDDPRCHTCSEPGRRTVEVNRPCAWPVPAPPVTAPARDLPDRPYQRDDFPDCGRRIQRQRYVKAALAVCGVGERMSTTAPARCVPRPLKVQRRTSRASFWWAETDWVSSPETVPSLRSQR